MIYVNKFNSSNPGVDMQECRGRDELSPGLRGVNSGVESRKSFGILVTG